MVFLGVPNGARTRDLRFHRPALCRLSYRHHGVRARRESKPSSVPGGHLSQPPRGPATSSPPWLLSTSGLGEPPANGRIGDCCGEDCPFHSARRPEATAGLVSVALARANPHANLDCRRLTAPPRLSPGTRALRSSDFPLTRVWVSDRPSRPRPHLSRYRPVRERASGILSDERHRIPYGAVISGAEGEI